MRQTPPLVRIMDTKKRIYCDHCSEYVSKTLYYQHRRLYFDKQSKRWSSERLFSTTDAGDAADSSAFSVEDADYDAQSSSSVIDQDLAFSVENDGTDDYECIVEKIQVEENSDSADEDDGPELWEDDESELQQTDNLGSPASIESKHLKVYLFFLFMFQTLFRLSDVALTVLLTFLSKFLGILAQSFNSPSLQSFSARLPRQIRFARHLVNSSRDNFQKFVCCPSCHSIYESSIYLPGNQQVSKKCSYVQFPSHPQKQHRKSCGGVLMKTVKTFSDKLFLHPRLIYCYRSVVESLQEMILRPHFLEWCEIWRNRNSQDNVYSDIYDGQIWKDFMHFDGKPFLSVPFNFAFHLNIDWFQPFVHTQHSEGVVYLSIMNLPRQQRFLQENVLLVGVIPGPKEPKLNINSFLKPMVDELLNLWKGVPLRTIHGTPVLVRAALLCAACDIPAARKTCGFVGHSALHGCSKCLIEFPTAAFGEKPDYSNFNQSDWKARENDSHRLHALKHRDSKTLAGQKEIERKYGVRYSVLLELPYFDAPRMCIIDPMHNLLLGTAKHMIEIWKKLNLLKDKDFPVIQERVDSFVAPNDSGRQPTSKISSGFSGLTAEQWKNWTIYYSLFSLKGILPFRHYQCWQLFVKACFLLCRRTITDSQLNEADQLFLEFCTLFVSIYGKDLCTPNMHLHCHLKECITDFGPVYAFWLFAFERLNGIMGSYHTNCRNISVQMTRRFLDSIEYAPNRWPAEFVSDFIPLLEQCRYNQGSLMQTNLETELTSDSISPIPPIKERAFDPAEMTLVQHFFDTKYKPSRYSLFILHKRTKALMVNNYLIGAHGSRYFHSSLVFAQPLNKNEVTLAEVQFFAQCSVNCEESNSRHSTWLAAVSWYMEHPCRVWYGYPTQVWCTTLHDGIEYIPIHNIKSRVAFTKASVHFGRIIGTDSVFVVTPLEYSK